MDETPKRDFPTLVTTKYFVPVGPVIPEKFEAVWASAKERFVALGHDPGDYIVQSMGPSPGKSVHCHVCHRSYFVDYETAKVMHTANPYCNSGDAFKTQCPGNDDEFKAWVKLLEDSI